MPRAGDTRNGTARSDGIGQTKWIRMGRAGEFEADILPRSGRPGWDGAGRHVQHSGEQAARAMEPVGGLHAGADAVRKAKRRVAIRVGWFVLARNAAGAAGFCERRSAVRKFWEQCANKN